MKRMRNGWIVLLLLLWLLPAVVHAAGSGEVLYHQQFSLLDRLEEGGVRIGTASGAGFSASVNSWSGLVLSAGEGERGAVILPEAPREGSFTLEFDFRFLSYNSENGYLAAILTSRGEEPSNVTSVVIRSGGSVDGFDALSEELSSAIRSGSLIHAVIPVRDGVLGDLILTCGELTFTAERETVQMITEGNVGFSVRNASVAVENVYLVSGTDYEEKTGTYVAESYAASPRVAPATGETAGLLLLLLISGACLTVSRRRS